MVSYVTDYDANDVHNWSGTGYYLAKALTNQNCQIEYIGNLKVPHIQLKKIKRNFYKKVIHKTYLSSRDPRVIKYFARQIQSRLKPETDIIFSPSSVPIALLESKKPKVIYTDATFAGMIEFYHTFSNLSKKTTKYGNYLEQKSLDSAELIIYSSEWAAQTAIHYYKVNPAKIHVVPFGANIICNRKTDDIQSIVQNRDKNKLNLLFLGVDWKRKGGDKALEIAEKLNQSGLKTTLNIAGIADLPFKNIPDFVINHGYLSKRTQAGVQEIEKLFITNHFLILPSLADCTPIVYSEANSFGLPGITTDVGGIPSIIKDDINGKKFPVNSEASVWCNYISSLFSDKERYAKLCLSSFDEYQKRLNWGVAGKTIMNLFRELISR